MFIDFLNDNGNVSIVQTRNKKHKVDQGEIPGTIPIVVEANLWCKLFFLNHIHSDHITCQSMWLQCYIRTYVKKTIASWVEMGMELCPVHCGGPQNESTQMGPNKETWDWAEGKCCPRFTDTLISGPSSVGAVAAASGGHGPLGLCEGLSATLLLHTGEELQCSVWPSKSGWSAQRVSLRGLCHQPGKEQTQVLVRTGLWHPSVTQVTLFGP